MTVAELRLEETTHSEFLTQLTQSRFESADDFLKHLLDIQRLAWSSMIKDRQSCPRTLGHDDNRTSHGTEPQNITLDKKMPSQREDKKVNQSEKVSRKRINEGSKEEITGDKIKREPGGCTGTGTADNVDKEIPMLDLDVSEAEAESDEAYTSEEAGEADDLTDGTDDKPEEGIDYDVQKLICKMCDPPKSLKRLCNLKRHLNLHCGVFRCSECAKRFDRKERLEVHKLKHTKDTKPFPCRTCGKSFTRKEGLVKHRREYHDVKFSCNLCPAKFEERALLRQHLTCEHPDGRFRCSNCRTQFKKSSSYHTHINVCKSSDPKFKCKFPGCNKVFNTKSLLDQHKSKHEEPQLICDHCGKTYKWMSSYNAHLKAAHTKTVNKRDPSQGRSENDDIHAKGFPTAIGLNVTGPQPPITISPKSREQMEYTFMQPFEIIPQTEQETDCNILPGGNFWQPPVDIDIVGPGSEMLPNQGQISMEMSPSGRDGLGQYAHGFSPNLPR